MEAQDAPSAHAALRSAASNTRVEADRQPLSNFFLILWKAANVLQNKLTRAQYLDEVTWTTKSWLGLQKQRISVVLHTAIAEQIVNELACGEGGRVHGAKCLAVLAGVA